MSQTKLFRRLWQILVAIWSRSRQSLVQMNANPNETQDPEEVEVYAHDYETGGPAVTGFYFKWAKKVATVHHEGTNLSRWDFFWKCENKNGPKGGNEDGIIREGSAWLPEWTDLETGLQALRAAGHIRKGSHRAGVYEVQNERGIYSHTDGNRLMGAPADKVEFSAWEE